VRVTPPAPPRRWERFLIVGGLLTLALLAGAATWLNLVRLQETGHPWEYAGATLDPRLVPSLTPTPTPAPPTATPSPRPSVTAAGVCAADALSLDVLAPNLGTNVVIGVTRLSATVRYCLRSRAQARIAVGVLGATPQLITYGEISIIEAGEGTLTRRLNWTELLFNLPPEGNYRVAAIMVDEFNNVLASIGTVEAYAFLMPTPTP
jgi:hypothetical protein